MDDFSPPPSEEIPTRFLELATRPLENHPEVRDDAQGELMGRLNFAARGREAEVDDATTRLETSAPGNWVGQAIAIAVLLLVTIVLAVAGGFAPFLEMRNAFGVMVTEGPEIAVFKKPAELTPEQRDFMASTLPPGGGSLFDFESLRKKYPDDPAVYEAVINFDFSRNTVPADYRETWQRLDPHNGIWSYKVAMKKMSEAVDFGAGMVRDEAVFTEGWEALQEALAAEHFQSRLPALRTRYVELLKPQETVIGRSGQFVLANYLGYGTNFSFPQPLATAFKIQAGRLETAKDTAGFHQLVKNWRRLVRKLSADVRTDQDNYAMQTIYRANTELLDVAKRMGATIDAGELERIEREMSAPSSSSFAHVGEMSMMLRSTGGMYWEGMDRELLKPGRMAEYAFTDQIVVILALAALVIVAIFLCIESVRRGKRLNGLANGLEPLFTGEDYLWIAGFGAGVPLLWFVGISGFTPLGCRDLGFLEFEAPISMMQALAAFLLVGAMLIQTAQWRITRRTGFLALGSRHLVVGWIIALLPAATIPLTGTVRYWSGSREDFLLAMLLSCGVPALWLLWQGGAMLFSPGSSALGKVLLARKLAWPVTGLCVLLLASYPLLRAAEKRWIAQDELTSRDPRDGGLTKMEQITIDKGREQRLKAIGSDVDPGW
ncbi:hypothetical protein [Luteolibacter luteus]|uniref:Uncharacterized protein n=1 Tax=Luteolibacter luteus TaxID=2728835 RepID=A0A858RIJ4_9BACT|nr:hypothetical protein [Luteolibacter luteus]QJE96727.1 hypothetical protein HHL09_13355 [Luteolibacter luteus]